MHLSKKAAILMFSLLWGLTGAGNAWADFRIERVDGGSIQADWYTIQKSEEKVIYGDSLTGKTQEMSMADIVRIDPIENSSRQATSTGSNRLDINDFNSKIGTEASKKRIDDYQAKRKDQEIALIDTKIKTLNELSTHYRNKISEIEVELAQLRQSPEENSQKIDYYDNRRKALQFDLNRIYDELRIAKERRSDLLFSK